MISILILTLNEEVDLPDCLASVSWCDDIVVFDSYSSDRTVEIAKAAGTRLLQREFDSYAAQRNAGLHTVKYKYPWVLMVDADERWPDTIYQEISVELGEADDSVVLYHFLRKDMFMGRWLRRSSGYPTWAGRLVRPDRVSVKRDINEEYHADGEVGYLKEHFIHYPFNKGIAHWFDRHNRYSSMEAEALVGEIQGRMLWKDIFSSVPSKRRKALKQLAYRLPLRPWLVFGYLYFIRMGFLDGKPGLTYARMRKMYESMIDLKVMELKRRKSGESV